MIAALLLFALGRRYLYKGPRPAVVAALAACVWYASPTSLMYTQNSLETGLYTMLVLLSVAFYAAIVGRLRSALSPAWCLLLGGLLGITFLGRNDACFLIAVMLAVHLILAHRQGAVRRGFVQARSLVRQAC